MKGLLGSPPFRIRDARTSCHPWPSRPKALPGVVRRLCRFNRWCAPTPALTRAEKLLHHAPFHGRQPLVQIAHPVHQRLLQSVVIQLVQVGHQVLLCTVQEPAGHTGLRGAAHQPVPPPPIPQVTSEAKQREQSLITRSPGTHPCLTPRREGHALHPTWPQHLYLCLWTSEAHVVRMLMAVSRVCLRDGTKTMMGFLGECFMMAW